MTTGSGVPVVCVCGESSKWLIAQGPSSSISSVHLKSSFELVFTRIGQRNKKRRVKKIKKLFYKCCNLSFNLIYTLCFRLSYLCMPFTVDLSIEGAIEEVSIINFNIFLLPLALVDSV